MIVTRPRSGVTTMMLVTQVQLELCCNSSQIGRHHNKKAIIKEVGHLSCNSSQIGRHHNFTSAFFFKEILVVTRPRSDVTTIYQDLSLNILDTVVTRPRSYVTTIQTCSNSLTGFICCNSSQIGRHHNPARLHPFMKPCSCNSSQIGRHHNIGTLLCSVGGLL